uniref:Uncharacterized protein n=1 Tax=Araneus ventricosus TaxID=182803 RepID=A0A4Y2WF44_ARAVE|nr:hypothetical protein AVEN_256044-1 [Araneus ventricosus]GBO35836.1 hypothetical protein AVEN_258569-1 [Araneus ventricosus]GBO35839.1 hypothetical protein AVEN_82867-1 [Araneus ventricosus]
MENLEQLSIQPRFGKQLPKLKEHLSGTRLFSACDVKSAAENELNGPAMECDRYGVSDGTATLFASVVLQDIGIVHEGEASHVVDRNKIRRQRKKL